MAIYDYVKICPSYLPDQVKDYDGWITFSFDDPFLNVYYITQTKQLLKQDEEGNRYSTNSKSFFTYTGELRFRDLDLTTNWEFVVFFIKGVLIEFIQIKPEFKFIQNGNV